MSWDADNREVKFTLTADDFNAVELADALEIIASIIKTIHAEQEKISPEVRTIRYSQRAWEESGHKTDIEKITEMVMDTSIDCEEQMEAGDNYSFSGTRVITSRTICKTKEDVFVDLMFEPRGSFSTEWICNGIDFSDAITEEW